MIISKLKIDKIPVTNLKPGEYLETTLFKSGFRKINRVT